MLLELKVSNFAIIDNVHIEFRKGLNILSGETGAGKSVLLKSLSLLMGLKGSSESIRSGCTQASIEGSFDLSDRKDIMAKLHEQGIETEDNLLIVKRVLSEDKSRVYLNGSLSTLNNLRDTVAPLIEVAGDSAPLIEMTGQFENRNLMSKHYHLDLLDQYTGTWDLRREYEKRFQIWNGLKSEIQKLENDSQNKTQRLDFLLYQRDEIAKLNLSPGEDQALEVELKKLKSLSKLSQFVTTAENALVSDDDSASQRLSLVMQKAKELSQIDPLIAAKAEALEQIKSQIEDISYELRQHISQVDADPRRLETLEERLSDLRKIQKKYGSDVSQILQALVSIENEIHVLQNSEEKIQEMKLALGKIEKELMKVAVQMHNKRVGGSQLLADSVNAELADLNMKGVSFHVQVEKLTDLRDSGISEAEFLSQTSAKDPKRPLAKFASGGELSRILLSLKRVVGSGQQPRTYLFDEVDTGVSGPTAEKVGKKLRSIAKGQQVICITHLPQVAAFGDAHFFIQKSPQKGSIAMEVVELKKADRVKEIARLISGEKISKTSLAHAEQLLSEVK